MTAPATRGPAIQAELRRLLQTRLLHESGLVLFGHPLLIALTAVLYWEDVPHGLLVGWGVAVVAATALRRVWLGLVARRALSDREIRRGVQLTVFLLGGAWGVGAAVLVQHVPLADAAFVLVALAAITAGGLTTLAADPPSYFALLASIAGSLFAGVLVSGLDREHLVMAGSIVLYSALLTLVGIRTHAAILDQLHATAQLAASEEAAKRAEEVMREARDLAERVSGARSAFLANMSHEIRTPMNAVLGFIELVLDTELSTEQRRALELVRASSETLLAILNDILDYSKIEAEHLDLEVIPFDLAKVVHATAGLLAVRAREKHLELLAEVAPDAPRAVRGDPTRLRQVLTNLIGNAIKFTETGEVIVSVTRVGIGPEDGRARLRFSVRDTGIGIAPDQVKAIFEEFMQADPSMTRRYGGTGLGLAISQRLVKLMGGTLEVATEVGRGSEFHFTVPLPIETTPGVLPAGRATLGGHRVLVVDDNQTNRRILRDLLAAEGIAIDEASSGTAGLEALRRAVTKGAPYDLAILDVQMPDRDGFEIAAEVRADRGFATTRLLMLTSAGQRGDGERCRTLGIEGYLTKPISRADLIDALGVVLAAPATPVATQAPASPARAPSPAGGRVPELVTRHSIVESRPTLRILLAEDNAVNQQVAAALLLKRGHEVDIVSDGRQAVAAVEREIYDVVLMDIQMPEMDGFAATHAIRALPGRQALPIIALTAHALSGERERCLAQGMTGYLAKPFKAHELFALIETRESPPPRTHTPVDVEAFRATMHEAGAADAVDGILDTFAAQLPERLTALETALANGHSDATARAAHALKGSAATIGAHDLARLLVQIEATARARGSAPPGREMDAVAGVGPGELADARELLEQVQAEARAVLELLQERRSP